MSEQRERAVYHQNDVPLIDNSDFGGFEILKGHYHAHPIYKSIKLAEGKKPQDIFTFVDIPRRQRSMGRGRSKKKAAAQGVEKDVGKNPKKAKKARGKSRDGGNNMSDCEVICVESIGNARPLRRLRGSTTRGRNLGQLDSTKFDIHIENIWSKLSEEKKNDFSYLGSFIFSMYATHKEKALGWIKKMDIFSKKYVFVPIVHWGHWFLLIFCNLGENPEAKAEHRCMLLLDSMRKANSTQMEPVIRGFVYDIFKAGERPESEELIRKIPFKMPKVPQQTDDKSCGFFILYYIDLLLKSASDDFSFFLDSSPDFMNEDWFTSKKVECFKESLESMA